MCTNDNAPAERPTRLINGVGDVHDSKPVVGSREALSPAPWTKCGGWWAEKGSGQRAGDQDTTCLGDRHGPNIWDFAAPSHFSFPCTTFARPRFSSYLTTTGGGCFARGRARACTKGPFHIVAISAPRGSLPIRGRRMTKATRERGKKTMRLFLAWHDGALRSYLRVDR